MSPRFSKEMLNLEPRLLWQRCLINSKPNRVFVVSLTVPTHIWPKSIKIHLQHLGPENNSLSLGPKPLQ